MKTISLWDYVKENIHGARAESKKQNETCCPYKSESLIDQINGHKHFPAIGAKPRDIEWYFSGWRLIE